MTKKDDFNTAEALLLMTTLVFAAAFIVTKATAGVYWPYNHEYLTFFKRTMVFATHFSNGDLLPLWSSADNLGLGSPHPAYYHRLFYMVAGGLTTAGATVRDSVAITIVFFLAIGGLGLYAASRELASGRVIAVSAALSLVFANYTTTNWLIRGAVGELAAAMLIPWLLYGLLRTIRLGRISKVLGVSLGLILAGHSVIAYYSLLFTCAIVACAVLARRIPFNLQRLRASLPAAGLFILLAAPSLFSLLIFRDDYDMSRITASPFTPREQMQPFDRYFWSPFWTWGERWDGFTVQIDTGPLVAIVSLVALMLWRRPDPRGKIFQLSMIGGLVLVCLFLQSSLSLWFYDWMPGAKFIQFPWRLLAFITPAIILLSMVLFEWVRIPAIAIWGPIGVCLAVILVSGALAPMEYGGFSEEPNLTETVNNWGGEYIPLRAISPQLDDTLAAAQRQPCQVRRVGAIREQMVVRFAVRCTAPGRVALPFFSSRWHAIAVRGGKWQRCEELAKLPALCAVQVPAGRTKVRVTIPTLMSVFRVPS